MRERKESSTKREERAAAPMKEKKIKREGGGLKKVGFSVSRWGQEQQPHHWEDFRRSKIIFWICNKGGYAFSWKDDMHSGRGVNFSFRA